MADHARPGRRECLHVVSRLTRAARPNIITRNADARNFFMSHRASRDCDGQRAPAPPLQPPKTSPPDLMFMPSFISGWLMVDASQPTFAMNRGRRLACAVGAMAWSEFYCVGNRFDPGPGASVVGFTPRRARYAYSTEHHAAGLDDQSAAGGQESRKITQPAHRLSRLRVGGKRSGWGTKTGGCRHALLVATSTVCAPAKRSRSTT